MKNNVNIIFHIDMNAFFISCELINNPNLKNKPIAIAGKNAIYNKGVISTASYEARKYGVKAAMPVFKAKELCPQLIILASNMDLYHEYSDKFIDFLKKYTPIIEIASIDEAYIDVTEICKNIHPLDLAKEIQQKLFNDYKLPSSIGIASNKFLAKMASDMKKPMGITVLRKSEIKEKLWPLEIGEMYGIGKKTAPKLIDCGIKKIEDLVKEENKEKAISILGNQFEQFYLLAKGYGDNVVDPSKNDITKSIGNSLTYNEPIIDEVKAYEKLKELTLMVTNRLLDYSYLTKTISIQIKYTNFFVHSKSKTIIKYTQSFEDIYNIIINLFDELWNRTPIRLLGVSTSNIIEKKEYIEQLDLFTYEKYTEDENVIKLINQINRKFGENTIKKGYRIKK